MTTWLAIRPKMALKSNTVYQMDCDGCHIDENRTQALSHEGREMEASARNRSTATTWLSILPKIASKSITI